MTDSRRLFYPGTPLFRLTGCEKASACEALRPPIGCQGAPARNASAKLLVLRQKAVSLLLACILGAG